MSFFHFFFLRKGECGISTIRPNVFGREIFVICLSFPPAMKFFYLIGWYRLHRQISRALYTIDNIIDSDA